MSNPQYFDPLKPFAPSHEEAMVFTGTDGLPLGLVMIGVTYPMANYRILREKSDVFNFEYVADGYGEVCLDGKWTPVEPGDTYILRSGERQEYRSRPDNPWKKMWATFECPYMSAFLDAYGITSGVYKADTQTHFETLISLSRSGAPFRDICFSINDCLHHIVESVAARKNSDSLAFGIRKALGAAVYRKCTLDEIADELLISKSTLIRTFKNAYSVSPYEYLLNAKTEAAKLLLLNTRITLKEISDLLCISDEHGFSAMFYRRTGIRPGAFRKKREK